MTVMLVCPTCPDPYEAPVVDGVWTISPATLSTVQTTAGPTFLALCPQCAAALTGATPPIVSQV